MALQPFRLVEREKRDAWTAAWTVLNPQASSRKTFGVLKSLILGIAILAAGCASIRVPLPRSPGEQNSGYTYVPLDPLPVLSEPGVGCKDNGSIPFEKILQALPDNAVRIAVASFDISGQVSFGPVQIGTSGNNYQVVLDYINVDTANIYFDIWYTPDGGGGPRSLYGSDGLPTAAKISVVRFDPTGTVTYQPNGDIVVIPVYVGLGLRLTATINVVKGKVNLSSLGAIAAEAQAGKLTGSLVVQTLGVTGSQITTSLPLPSELNATTVQNAILSLGSIKAVLYDDEAIKTPRVTGIYNPIGIGGQRLINAIVSELAKKPIEWKRPCAGSETR
jgi:hypothetical protein